MPNMKFRLTSDGRRTSVTHAVTGETIPCKRVEFQHWVGECPVLNLEILCSDIEVDITSDGETVAGPEPLSPEEIADAEALADTICRDLEAERAAAYDRTWGRR